MRKKLKRVVGRKVERKVYYEKPKEKKFQVALAKAYGKPWDYPRGTEITEKRISEMKKAEDLAKKIKQLQKEREEKYREQQAKISLGFIPSKERYEKERRRQRFSERLQKIESRIYSGLKKRALSRRLLKKSRAIVVIPKKEEAPYVSRYFIK